MRLRSLILSLVVFTCLAGTGFSQEPLTVEGTLDGYWSYNFNKPFTESNAYRAFDVRDNSFSLNYGEVALSYKPMDVGVRLDLGFGDAADIVHSSEPAGQDLWRHVQQAYVTLTHDNLTVDFGKFVTPIGAEVIETSSNWNYSRGILFTWAIPFYHFGARAAISPNDKTTLMGYVVNGWNNVADNNKDKSVGFFGSFKPVGDNMTLVTNYLVGKETTGNARHMLDGIITYDASSNVSVMANYDYGMDKVGTARQTWQGIAAYGKFSVPDKVVFSPRWEWFQDRDGFMTGDAQELKSFTATVQVPWSGATLWGEYRHDWSDAMVFPNETTFEDKQDTVVIGLTFNFMKEIR